MHWFREKEVSMGKLLNEMGNCPFASPLIAPLSLGDIPMTHRIIPPYVCIYSRAYILLCVLFLLLFFTLSSIPP